MAILEKVSGSYSTRTGGFVKQGGSYVPNGGAPVLSPLAASLAFLANRDNEAWRVWLDGDSWGEGRNVAQFSDQWSQKIQPLLRTAFPTAGLGSGGGIGFVPMFNANSVGTYVNQWTKSGGGLVYTDPPIGGLGLRYGTFGSVGVSKASITVVGTSAIIHFYRGNGTRTAYYKVDGGAAVNFETGGGTGTDNGFQVVNLGASGSHTLEVGLAAGSPCYISGAVFFNGDENKGITFYEGGHSGFRVLDYITATSTGAANLNARFQAVNPHMWIIALAENDYAINTGFRTPAQYKADLKALIAQRRALGYAGSILLMLPPDCSAIKAAGQTATWAQFVTAAKEVASEDTGGAGGVSAVKCIVMSDTPGTFPPSPGAGAGTSLWDPDGGHFTSAGQALIGPWVVAAIN